MDNDAYALGLTVIREAIGEILVDRGEPLEPIDEDRPLYAYDDSVTDSLELDSMDALDLMSVVESRLGIEVSDGLDYESIRTVRDLATIVGSHQQAPDS